MEISTLKSYGKFEINIEILEKTLEYVSLDRIIEDAKCSAEESIRFAYNKIKE